MSALSRLTMARGVADGIDTLVNVERVQFANNALHYQTGMTVMTQQIKAMIAAITSNQ